MAEAYIHEEIEALPYLHEEIPKEEPEPAGLVIPQPVVPYYAYAPVAVTNYAALPKEEAAKKVALISPFHLVAGYKAGCLNSLGSLVPCHL